MEVSFEANKAKTFIPRHRSVLDKLPRTFSNVDLSIPESIYKRSSRFLTDGYFNYWKNVLGNFFNVNRFQKRKININNIEFLKPSSKAIHKSAEKLKVKLIKMEIDFKKSLRPISRLYW